MTEHNFEAMRKAMVSNQLRTTAVNDPRVVEALGAVPREKFVPAERVAAAYADIAVPLGNGRSLNSPMAIGRLLTEAHPRPADRALVVGVATGYTAALLAALVASVVAVEEDEALVGQARSTLGDGKVEVVQAPLTAGYAAGAPYDLIVIDGAVDVVPQPLIDQLADEGRLATGIRDRGVLRLAVGQRSGSGFALLPFADADMSLLSGFQKPAEFVF